MRKINPNGPRLRRGKAKTNRKEKYDNAAPTKATGRNNEKKIICLAEETKNS